MSEKFETYLFEYKLDGARWGFEVKAESPQDAIRRVRALSSQALFVGTLQFKLPAVAPLGLIPRAICAIGNLISSLYRSK